MNSETQTIRARTIVERTIALNPDSHFSPDDMRDLEEYAWDRAESDLEDDSIDLVQVRDLVQDLRRCRDLFASLRTRIGSAKATARRTQVERIAPESTQSDLETPLAELASLLAQNQERVRDLLGLAEYLQSEAR